MKKNEIVKMLLPSLKDKNLFSKISQNNFYPYLTDEDVFQFFVVNILREHDFKVIVNEKSGNRKPFERYKFKSVGNLPGVSDLLVLTRDKNIFLELKSCIWKCLNKDLSLKKDKHIQTQAKFIKEMNNIGITSLFLYPENIEDNFSHIFGIELKKY